MTVTVPLGTIIERGDARRAVEEGDRPERLHAHAADGREGHEVQLRGREMEQVLGQICHGRRCFGRRVTLSRVVVSVPSVPVVNAV